MDRIANGELAEVRDWFSPNSQLAIRLIRNSPLAIRLIRNSQLATRNSLRKRRIAIRDDLKL